MEIYKVLFVLDITIKDGIIDGGPLDDTSG